MEVTDITAIRALYKKCSRAYKTKKRNVSGIAVSKDERAWSGLQQVGQDMFETDVGTLSSKTMCTSVHRYGG